ncbi:hypothetical protein [Embleya sp. AB8]|uniref:hypothetical protein n=1 Tax=Embleya sp. AB8 TaxID=3156304 RepID=UPI003C725372
MTTARHRALGVTVSNDSLSHHDPHRHLLLVLNGPYGVGKRAVAAALVRHLRDATVLDPESIDGPAPERACDTTGDHPPTEPNNHTPGTTDNKAPEAAAPDKYASPEATSTNHRAPGGTHTQAPDRTNHKAPDGTNHKAPDGTNHQVPDGTNHQAPGGANDQAPAGTNHQLPGETNHKAPGETNHQLPGETNHQAPGETNHKAPDPTNHHHVPGHHHIPGRRHRIGREAGRRDLSAKVRDRRDQHDHPDLPARRALIADAAAAERARRPGPILLPATLLDRAHCAALLDLLVDRGFDVRHVTLHLDPDGLRARVGAAESHPAQEREYAAAEAWLHARTLVVDTTATSPDTIAVGLAEALLAGSLPAHRPSRSRADTRRPAGVEDVTVLGSDVLNSQAAAVYRAANRINSAQLARLRDIRRRNG